MKTDKPEDQTSPPFVQTPAWLLTFTDLTALLLAFFVMLLSMQQLEEETWQAITESLTRQLNPDEEKPVEAVEDDEGVEEVFLTQAANLDYLAALVTEKINDHPLLIRAHLSRLHDRLVLSLPGDLVFDPGQVTISEDGLAAAGALAEVLVLLGNRVEIAGHTDPDPVVTEQFPSNWELSLARATAMAAAIRRAGYTGTIAAFGLADSRFEDLSKTFTDAERAILARRVDIIIRQSAGDAYAP